MTMIHTQTRAEGVDRAAGDWMAAFRLLNRSRRISRTEGMRQALVSEPDTKGQICTASLTSPIGCLTELLQV